MNLHRRFHITKITVTIGMVMFVILGVAGFSAASTEHVDGDDTTVKQDWYIGPRVGISAFTGLIGIEAQHLNFALSGGFPGNVGVKYYLKPDGHSGFIGAYFSHFNADSDDLPYGYGGHNDDTTWNEGGLGIGHRWRWGTGWDLSLSFAVGYGERKEPFYTTWRITTYIGLRPGVTFGYSF